MSKLPAESPLGQASSAEIKRNQGEHKRGANKRKSGFKVEYRLDGYYYIKVIPKYCRDIKIGDRILEINGVKAFNFQSAARADELFDTLYLVYYDKDEAEKQKQKHNDAQRLSSEGQARQRKGRRSRFEEEARQIGARRQDEKNRWERKLKEIEEEEELKRAESELRRLELRRRRAEEEARKSPSPPQAPTRRSSISVETNLGTFSPTPRRGFVKGGWSKISSNHKRNG